MNPPIATNSPKRKLDVVSIRYSLVLRSTLLTSKYSFIRDVDDQQQQAKMASAEQVGLNKTWELSLYELNRSPQDAITDNTEIAVSPRSLHSELMCPICLDMLKKTMTTKECLHRFCSDCIITALRSGNKECPTCRKKLVSKRSLRPDPNFDLLISKIYPSRDEYEAHQERVLAKLNKSHSQAALVNSITEGIKIQLQNRPQRARKTATEPETTPNNTPNTSAPSTPTPLQNDLREPITVPVPPTLSTNVPMPTPLSGPPGSASTQAATLSQPVPSQTNQIPQPNPQPQSSQPSVQSSLHPKPPKRAKSIHNSENESAGSSVEAGGQDSSVGEGDGPSEPIMINEIELVFKPHPTEMGGDNSLIKALKENSVRYIKTTANASGKKKLLMR